MTDTEEELRRVLTRRAEGVRSNLSGPAIRARASKSRSTLRRFAPLVSAAAVLAVVAVSLLLLPHGPDTTEPARPTTVLPTTNVPSTPQSTITTSPQSSNEPTTTPRTTVTTRSSNMADPPPGEMGTPSQPGSRSTPGPPSATTTTSFGATASGTTQTTKPDGEN